jgi:hypothetical protein
MQFTKYPYSEIERVPRLRRYQSLIFISVDIKEPPISGGSVEQKPIHRCTQSNICQKPCHVILEKVKLT